MNISDANWQEFSLSDYFNMHTGRYYAVSSFEHGPTPLVTAKSVYNGISHFTNIEPKFPSGCLTIGKVGLDVFYQYSPFVASSDVTVLEANFEEYNSYIGKFIATCARQQASVFGYGNQIRLNDSKKLKIMLPANREGFPDWQYIENYMTSLEKNIYEKTAAHLEEDVSQQDENKVAQWGDIPIGKVFDLIQRGKRLIKRDQIPGETPYVSSTATNNGIDNFIDNSVGVRIFENGITIANSGSVGATFYHPYRFIGSDHVTILKSQKASLYSYLFLVAALSKLGEKYAFNREMSDTRIRREKIIIPLTPNGTPDWDYMDSYMKNQETRKILEWLQFTKQVTS